MKKDYVPILCLDFDGVLHSYTSGWKGPRCIPDPPVIGAIPWLRSLLSVPDCVCPFAPRYLDFDVQIYSSRSRYWGGRWAMRSWLANQFEKCGYPPQLVELLKFPKYKPPAFLTIDDRAVTFSGKFPTVEELKSFKSWWKEGTEG